MGKSPNVLPLSNCTYGLSCGLVGYWTFDGKDMVGGVVRDRSGNGNNGNLNNIATSTFYTPGKIGQAGNFDGSNDYIFKTTINPNNFNNITISAWLKPNNIGTEMRAVLVGENEAFVGINASGQSMSRIYDGVANRNIAGTNNYSNKWVHVLMTSDGVIERLYENGVQVNSTSAGNLNWTNQSITFGSLYGSTGSWFNGLIDDVRVYNRALSTSEISQLYSSGASNKQSSSSSVVNTSTCSIGLSCGLVGYWTFDGKDIVNGVVRDRSGSGTVANTANISTSTFYTAGVKGQALRFTSNNDYIFSDLGTARSTFTISLWYTPRKASDWQGNQTGFQMGKTTYNESNFYRWYSTGNNPRIQASSNNGGSSAQSTVYSSETRLPYLNTFVYTPTQIDWYINGVLYNSTAPSVGTFDAMRFITLGGTGNANQSVNGVIDEFRVYDRALTVGEIKQLYISNISTKQSSSQNIIQNSSCISGLSCGLVGYWTFDGKDMVGGVVRDRSGNGNNGNLNNIATSTFYTPGKIGQAGNFDGTNDYISMGDILDLNGGVPFSISTWALFNDFTNSPSIIGKFDESGSYAYTLEMGQLFETDGSGLGLMLLDSSSAGYIGRSTSRKIVKGVWYHIVGTYDGGSTSSSVKLYYNGVQVDDTNTQGGTFTTIRNVNTPLTIGSLLSSGSPNYLIKGKIDDVRIYNRVLSQSEVAQLYNTGR